MLAEMGGEGGGRARGGSTACSGNAMALLRRCVLQGAMRRRHDGGEACGVRSALQRRSGGDSRGGALAGVIGGALAVCSALRSNSYCGETCCASHAGWRACCGEEKTEIGVACSCLAFT